MLLASGVARANDMEEPRNAFAATIVATSPGGWLARPTQSGVVVTGEPLDIRPDLEALAPAAVPLPPIRPRNGEPLAENQSDGVGAPPVQVASLSSGNEFRQQPAIIEREPAFPRTLAPQTDRVAMSCLKPELTAIIAKAAAHFGGQAVVTSGFRGNGRRGSYHRRCEAADFFIEGVSQASLARFLRDLPESGGVGTYCHTKSVHVDIGEARNWFQCGRRMRFALR